MISIECSWRTEIHSINVCMNVWMQPQLRLISIEVLPVKDTARQSWLGNQCSASREPVDQPHPANRLLELLVFFNFVNANINQDFLAKSDSLAYLRFTSNRKKRPKDAELKRNTVETTQTHATQHNTTNTYRQKS